MCRVLEVFPSGYYAWRQRMISARTKENQNLQQRIETIYRRLARHTDLPGFRPSFERKEPESVGSEWLG
jgi:hypothetical protein